uniref:twin-arginine translocation signal domain-containing protein n=1 Tax=Pseudomonas aeruginosa TaxID=287 RepID=UPI001A912634|nr:twin-arginine translocation signal domain-containing protein [Pseudomonas aeruginosa]
MEVSRRRFVKMSAAASAAAAIGFGVKTQEAAAMSASIATLLFIDPITLEYKIFGPCCHFCPDHLIVSHYQPVALVEVIKVRIPRHPATQSALIWPGIPRPSGHLFHGHPAGQSERSDAGGALLV